MNDNRPMLGGFAWPSVVVVVLGLYAYWTGERELTSARPQNARQGEVPGPVSSKGFEAVHARLWEDPLGTANAASGRSSPPAPGGFLDSLFSHPKADPQQDLNDNVRTMVRHAHAPKQTICLPIFVPGGPTAEDKEHRIRTQYAVLSALSRCGIALSFPDRVSYATLPKIEVSVREGEQSPTNLVVPFKIFRADKADAHSSARALDRQILALWINESQLGSKPLATLGRILERFFGHWPAGGDKTNDAVWSRLKVCVIGPASSDTLLAIAEEYEWIRKNDRESIPPIEIFSPRATAGGEPPAASPASDVREVEAARRAAPQVVSSVAPQSPARESINHFEKLCSKKNSRVKFIRAIGRDADLVTALGEELALRDCWPRDQDDGKLVLLTEQDTLYGREIVECIRNQLLEDQAPVGSEYPKSPLVVRKYLRGIDGRATGTGREENARNPTSSASGGRGAPMLNGDPSATFDAAKAEHRPEGPSQYDYLVRLRRELEALDRSDGIKAIGVVGTDVYDKLLILRALRPSFPHTAFFTTDLDAHLAHPEEFRSTRNLIVASHFGLQFSSELQGEVAPFRESYQTATMLACLLALEHDFKDLDFDRKRPWDAEDTSKRLSPLVFEIGRNGPYQLTLVAEHSVQPRGQRQAAFPYGAIAVAAIGAALLTLLATCGVSKLKELCSKCPVPDTMPIIMGVLAASMLVSGYLIGNWEDATPLGNWEEFEPFDLAHGVSMWPAFLVRLITVVGTLAFFVHAGSIAGTRRSRESNGFTTRKSDAGLRQVRVTQHASAKPSSQSSANEEEAQETTLTTSAKRTTSMGVGEPVPDDPEAEQTMAEYDKHRPERARGSNSTSAIVSHRSNAGLIMQTRVFVLENMDAIEAAVCCVAALVLVAAGILLATDYRALRTMAMRGPGATQFLEIVVRLCAEIVAAFAIVFVIVKMESCRRELKRLGTTGTTCSDALVQVQAAAKESQFVAPYVAWAAVLLALLALSYHPRLDYAPLPVVPLVFGLAAIATLVGWSLLVRQAAARVKASAIAALQEDKGKILSRSALAAPTGKTPETVTHDAATQNGDPQPTPAGLAAAGAATATLTRPMVKENALPTPGPQPRTKEQVDHEIAQITAISDGAYRPWLSTPGAAWLTGSAGAWAVVSWLLYWLQSGM
ncbi:MAG: hypothetical protein AB7O59_00240 [Pirellulales bacterium]